MNSSGWPDPVLSTCSLTPSPAVIVGMDGLPERRLAGQPGTAASRGAGRRASGDWSVVGDVLDAHDVLVRARRGRRRVPGAERAEDRVMLARRFRVRGGDLWAALQ